MVVHVSLDQELVGKTYVIKVLVTSTESSFGLLGMRKISWDKLYKKWVE